MRRLPRSTRTSEPSGVTIMPLLISSTMCFSSLFCVLLHVVCGALVILVIPLSHRAHRTVDFHVGPPAFPSGPSRALRGLMSRRRTAPTRRAACPSGMPPPRAMGMLVQVGMGRRLPHCIVFSFRASWGRSGIRVICYKPFRNGVRKSSIPEFPHTSSIRQGFSHVISTIFAG